MNRDCLWFKNQRLQAPPSRRVAAVPDGFFPAAPFSFRKGSGPGRQRMQLPLWKPDADRSDDGSLELASGTGFPLGSD